MNTLARNTLLNSFFDCNSKEYNTNRFFSKVDKNGPIPSHCQELGQCWIWTAAKCRGYGKFRFKKKYLFIATHVSYFLHHGSISDDLHILHHCDNPACVNPLHLFPGTDADNVKDKCDKNRQTKGFTSKKRARGIDNASAKLNPDKVREIRRLVSLGNKTHLEISKLFGVSKPQIHYISKRITWAHVD